MFCFTKNKALFGAHEKRVTQHFYTCEVLSLELVEAGRMCVRLLVRYNCERCVFFFFSPIISPLFLSCIGPNSKSPVSRGCAAHQHYSLSCSFSVGGQGLGRTCPKQCFPDLFHRCTHIASLLMVSFLLDGSHLETRNKLGGSVLRGHRAAQGGQKRCKCY